MKKQLVVVSLVIVAVLIIGGIAFAANVNLEQKEAAVEEKVRAGELSEEAGKSFMEELQARRAECGECDGTRQGWNEDRERLGQENEIGFRHGNGEGRDSTNDRKGGNGLGLCRWAD